MITKKHNLVKHCIEMPNKAVTDVPRGVTSKVIALFPLTGSLSPHSRIHCQGFPNHYCSCDWLPRVTSLVVWLLLSLSLPPPSWQRGRRLALTHTTHTELIATGTLLMYMYKCMLELHYTNLAM